MSAFPVLAAICKNSQVFKVFATDAFRLQLYIATVSHTHPERNVLTDRET